MQDVPITQNMKFRIVSDGQHINLNRAAIYDTRLRSVLLHFIAPFLAIPTSYFCHVNKM